MASSLNSLLGSSPSAGTTGNSSGAANSTDGTPAPSEEVFLQLLVSQIQNQDPLNPTDSTQFVSQLAQFSELEQVIGIRSDIETYMSDSAQQSSTTPPTAEDRSTNPANATDSSTTPNSPGTSTNSIN
jgi:flagellar basal-body rod modification protein FlgD